MSTIIMMADVAVAITTIMMSIIMTMTSTSIIMMESVAAAIIMTTMSIIMMESVAVVITIVFAILKHTIGLRVTPEEEITGLDVSEHGLLTSKQPSRDQNNEDLKRILSYIHTHSMERIYVRDLAGLLSLNEPYFCRLFKKAIGQSTLVYVTAYRIRRACALLRDSTQPVTDICLECGFSNFGNFLREFRKQTGLTPLKYRRKSRS